MKQLPAFAENGCGPTIVKRIVKPATLFLGEEREKECLLSFGERLRLTTHDTRNFSGTYNSPARK